jgi:hypothetical protein
VLDRIGYHVAEYFPLEHGTVRGRAAQRDGPLERWSRAAGTYRNGVKSPRTRVIGLRA